MSDELPEGWARARIGDVFDCWGGMTPSTSEAKFWGGSMPWISSKDVKGPVVAGGTECVTDYALAENRLRTCPAGTVLVVVRSGVLVHTLPVAVINREVVVNQDVKALDSGDRQLNAWAALYLRATQREILEANRKEGTTVQSIRVPELLDHELAVAPLAEQRRIVAKVEALLEQVRRAKDRLDRVPLMLKRFRQAVLAAACSGRLTESWRQSRTDRSTGDDVVRVARAEAADREGAGDHDAVVGDADIPSTWAWASLGDITVNHDGRRVPVKSSDREKRKGPYPYYGASGVIDSIDGYLFDGEFLLIAEDGANLLSRSTPIAFPASGKFWVNNHAHIVHARAGIPLDYLRVFLNGIDLQEFVTGTAQPKLTQKALNGIPVPVPPLDEQVEIVRRVDDLFALATAVEQRVERAAMRAGNLPQAILSKAFAGQLVPTEADLARAESRDYETAAQLLDRVRRQEQATRAVPRRRRANA